MSKRGKKHKKDKGMSGVDVLFFGALILGAYCYQNAPNNTPKPVAVVADINVQKPIPNYPSLAQLAKQPTGDIVKLDPGSLLDPDSREVIQVCDGACSETIVQVGE